jgi:hypothetical protein
MAFNTASLISKRGPSKLSACYGKKEITLDMASAGITLPKHYFVTEPSAEAPLYKFVYREAFGYHLEPVDKPKGMIGPMFDGVYAIVDYKVKSALEKKLGYPISEVIHVMDRFETQKMYDALSN